MDDSHLPEAGPCWRLLSICESSISRHGCCARLLFEYRLKRTLPTFAKCGNPQRALQLLAGMSWQIQKCINLGYGDPLRTVSNFYDIIARANFSLLQHAKVKSWSVMCYEQGRHARFIHSNPDAVARYAWLGHFKFSVTDA